MEVALEEIAFVLVILIVHCFLELLDKVALSRKKKTAEASSQTPKKQTSEASSQTPTQSLEEIKADFRNAIDSFIIQKQLELPVSVDALLDTPTRFLRVYRLRLINRYNWSERETAILVCFITRYRIEASKWEREKV